MDVVKALRAQRGAAAAAPQKLTSQKFNNGSVDAFYTETGKELGKGAYGRVVQVRQKTTGKLFALKLIEKKRMLKKQFDEVQSEIAILEALNHPNIIDFQEVFESPTQYLILMEQLEGGELLDEIVSRSQYSEKDASDAIAQCLQAVDYMHRNNTMHRDIKPENLLLDRKGPSALIKLVDFGISKKIASRSAKLTEFIGSPGYMAPEVIACKEWRVGLEGYGLEADMWSVGVILFVLLSGRHPFPLDDEANLDRAIERGSYNFNEPVWRSVSESAKDLIRKLMTVDPARRLTAAQALQHPWIHVSPSPAALPEVHNGLKRFNARRKFQGAINAVKAIARLQKILAMHNTRYEVQALTGTGKSIRIRKTPVPSSIVSSSSSSSSSAASSALDAPVSVVSSPAAPVSSPVKPSFGSAPKTFGGSSAASAAPKPASSFAKPSTPAVSVPKPASSFAKPSPAPVSIAKPASSFAKPIPASSIKPVASPAPSSSGSASGVNFYSLSVLTTNPPADVDRGQLEVYLSDSEFSTVFKMTKAQFAALPKWKQTHLKKEKKLF